MIHVLSPASFRSQPWKNGGGVTHEIVRWPDVADHDVRISLADDRVPGPFSRFPGRRRWSFLAGPAPIELDVAGQVRVLAVLGDALEVDGDVPITCALPRGPTRLLNVLVRHGLDVAIGRGPCAHPIRFAFALAAQPWLPVDHAAVLDPPEVAALDELAIWLG